MRSDLVQGWECGRSGGGPLPYGVELPQRVSALRPARRPVSGLVVASPASTAGREHPASSTAASVGAGELRANLTLEGRSNLVGGAPASETCRPIGRREVAGFPF